MSSLPPDPDADVAAAPTGQLSRLERTTARGLSSALAGLAAVRRGKPVHPHGVTYTGELTILGHAEAPAARLLSEPAQYGVVVRFSRSLGLPRPLPDLLGVALRVLSVYGPGEDQDLLFISSVDRPILHHLFVPSGEVWAAPYSSSLPFRSGPRRFLLGLLPHLQGDERPAGADEFERLAGAVTAGRLRVDLMLAAVNGRFRTRLGEIRLDSEAAPELDALRYNPWHTGEDLEPTGWLNVIRAEAYRRSQSAWGTTQSGGARRQRVAEAEVLRFDQHRSFHGSGT
jgi:hypothetical protein